MFDWVQVRVLAGPLEDIQRLVFIKDFALFIFASIMTSLPVPEKHPQCCDLHRRDATRFPPDVTELCQSDHQVLGHLPDQGLSPPIAQFGRAASFRKNLVGSKLLPFKNDGGHYVLGDLQCCRNVLVAFPRSVPGHNPVSELYRQFPRPRGLVFALT